MQANFTHKLTLTICPVIELLVVVSTILLRFYGFHHVFEYGNNNNHVISGIQYGPTEVIRQARPAGRYRLAGNSIDDDHCWASIYFLEFVDDAMHCHSGMGKVGLHECCMVFSTGIDMVQARPSRHCMKSTLLTRYYCPNETFDVFTLA